MDIQQSHELFEQALAEGLAESQRRWPDAHPIRHAAYANTYAYARTGWAGGYGGPSLREHYACSLVHPPVSRERAHQVAAHVHDELSREQIKTLFALFGRSFDDDPEDLAALRQEWS